LFEGILSDDDARRATSVVRDLLALGFRGSLTGGLAIGAHLRARGDRSEPHPLNDVDFVVGSFADIPDSVADRFLMNHIHPSAPEGKTLMQLIDPEHALRVDLFRAYGATLSRSAPLGVETEPLDVAAFEDLAARTTSHVYGHVRNGRTIEAKYVRAMFELSRFVAELTIDEAWNDHRERLPDSFGEGLSKAHRILSLHPELIVSGEYSREITPCERCQRHGRFRCAPPEQIVEILGYW
jgi:hypothetical protein